MTTPLFPRDRIRITIAGTQRLATVAWSYNAQFPADTLILDEPLILDTNGLHFESWSADRLDSKVFRAIATQFGIPTSAPVFWYWDRHTQLIEKLT